MRRRRADPASEVGRRDVKGRGKVTHGGCLGGERTEYIIWLDMRWRCHRPTHHAFKNYGGRGIAVCARWRASFAAFLEDMGPRPSKGHSLDRIDNDGDYEPSNCRWATRRQQAQNCRSNVNLTIHGETLCMKEWSRRSGTPHTTIHNRLRFGWEPERAVFAPSRSVHVRPKKQPAHLGE